MNSLYFGIAINNIIHELYNSRPYLLIILELAIYTREHLYA